MEAEFNIPVNTEEGYSPEAIANLERAVEEFAEDLLKIKPEDANVMVFRTLAITMKGRKRRIGDLGNVESPEDPMKIELMIYNKEQIEEIVEFIRQNGFPAKNEAGSQYIYIKVPKPSRMQLEEMGDDLIRRTNSYCTRLMKIKTNTALRIRAAIEKEYIDQRIAGIATKKIDANVERVTKEIKLIGLYKRKQILGSFFKTVERDDAELLKIVSKRIKLERQRIENENQSKLQTETLSDQDQSTETINPENISNIENHLTDDKQQSISAN